VTTDGKGKDTTYFTRNDVKKDEEKMEKTAHGKIFQAIANSDVNRFSIQHDFKHMIRQYQK
jgi:hypothetical protein